VASTYLNEIYAEICKHLIRLSGLETAHTLLSSVTIAKERPGLPSGTRGRIRKDTFRILIGPEDCLNLPHKKNKF